MTKRQVEEEERYEDDCIFNEEAFDMEDLENRIDVLESRQEKSDGSCVRFIYTPGLVLAMILSYETNQSILWSLVHGCLSWVYVIYRMFY